MIQPRPADQRGYTRINWLDSRHSFSFGQYQDPDHMGFAALRVVNDDRVAPGAGFGTHPHHDMEIVTFVIEGALKHEDSTGGGGVLRPGDVQAMSAGTGLTHAEQNASDTEPVHFYQVWLLPDAKGHDPRYDQKHFDPAEQVNRLRPVVAGDGRAGALAIHQDAVIYRATLEAGQTVDHALPAGRAAWVQLIRGNMRLNDQTLTTGDGAAAEHEPALALHAVEPTELLLFDMAAG